MIKLTAIGGAEIRTHKATLTPSHAVAFSAALYLIVERGSRVSRGYLASLLWPTLPAAVQAHRLRQTIYQLRQYGITLHSDGVGIQLSRDEAAADLDDLSEARLRTVAAPAAEFLPGYVPRHSDEFRDWLDRTRERVHAAFTRAWLVELRSARTSGNWELVERVSQQCLRLDPYNEAAVLASAEAFAMRGQKAEAISILDDYVAEVGERSQPLVLPATILRRRVLQDEDRRPGAQPVTEEPDFVGRQREIAILTQLLGDARNGVGKACLIEGEPGIGKSRLSAEIARFAKLQGLAVELVACKRADTVQPLSAFVGLVSRLRELPGALGCSRQSWTWLQRLTEFDPSTQDAVRGEDPNALYTHLRSAVFDLLGAVSEERCLLIIVEDVQWLDRASAGLFAEILDVLSSKKILVLFTSRETKNPLLAAVPPNRMAEVHLRPLAEDEASALVRTLLTKSGIACEAKEMTWLINTCDGNPYFLQELTRHSIESGQRHAVPRSVASVLDERLSWLSAVAQQLLQACAVLGEHSNFDRLERVLGCQPQDLLRGIQELSTSGMVRPFAHSEATTQTLIVRHDLLSIQVLKSLAPASLAFLHRRCGSVLEEEVKGRSASISLMRACAFHWYQAGDAERAFDLALKCADHLLEIGLAADAANALEGAFGFCTDHQRQLEVLARIIQANRIAGDRLALLKTIKRLRTLQDSVARSPHHDAIEILEFEALRTTEIELAPLLLRMLSCVHDQSLPPAHRVESASVAVKVATMIADLDELTRIYNAVSGLLDDDTVLNRSRLQIQVIYNTMCGDLQRAPQFAKERLAYERTEGSTPLLVNAMADLAFVLRRTGPFEEVFSVLQEAYATAMEQKHYALARDCADKIASMMEEEELPGSEEWLHRATEGLVATEIHSRFSFNADATRVALRKSQLHEARRILENGFDWAWLQNRPFWLVAALGLRIRLHIAEAAKQSLVEPDVRELQQLYKSTAGLGRQDHEVAALIQGLVYIQAITEAMECVEDYITRSRRDVTPLSRELSAIAASFRANRTDIVSLVHRGPNERQIRNSGRQIELGAV